MRAYRLQLNHWEMQAFDWIPLFVLLVSRCGLSGHGAGAVESLAPAGLHPAALVVIVLAALFGLTLTRSGLQRRARRSAEPARNEEAEQFLGEAAEILFASLDYELTVQRVAALAVSRLAEWCIVYVPVDGSVERLAIAARNPELEKWARSIETQHPVAPKSPVQEVLRTGCPLLIPSLEETLRTGQAVSEVHLGLLRTVGVRSVMLVALRARGGILGTMALGSAERIFTSADLALAERLADRASIAVDNARLYREAERRASEEEALRRAAQAVAALFTIDEVIHQIAVSALAATGADAAFVERIDLERGEVEIVAASGQWQPAPGTRIPYSGSLAEEVIRSRAPLVVEDIEARGWIFQSGLRETCGTCSAVAVPLADSGEPIGALVLIRRLTNGLFRPDEQDRAQTFADLATLAFRKVHLLQESERRREEIERVTESRAALIRGFSHDLRNPLTAADGFLSLLELQARDIDPTHREYLTTARRSIGAALRLIADLVDLARAEAGQIDVRRASVDVREVAGEMVQEYRAQAEGHGLSIRLEIPPAIPLIESDVARIRQILSNLISNAVKYTSRGEVVVRVAVRDGTENGSRSWVIVDVSDTGPGIPTDKQKLLFQEFTRLDPLAANGAGLGLAISRRIAEALGGAINVESAPGRGSTFSLLLPAD